jgi:hypothetical protein
VISHETLIISPYGRYPDWFEGRRVVLHPLADGTVKIERYADQSGVHPSDTVTLACGSALVKVLSLIAEL